MFLSVIRLWSFGETSMQRALAQVSFCRLTPYWY
jgi:hypothetical protein